MSISKRFETGPWAAFFCIALAWSGGCNNPEPVTGPTDEPRNVPGWYAERPVDPRASTQEPAENSAQPELPPLIAQEAGAEDAAPAADTAPAPQDSAQPADDAEVPVNEPDLEAVPFAPIVMGDPTPFLGLPFEVPPIPAYRNPEAKDCDWIIEGGVARSRRGLPSIQAADNDGYLLGPAYRASVASRRGMRGLANGRPVTIGVRDDAGEGVMGGGWSLHSPRSVFAKNESGGFEDIAIEIVGLSETSEVSVSWDSRWGKPAYIGLFDIGIRGRKDSFIIRANTGIGRLILDGCWWLPAKEFTVTQEKHASGMHIDSWSELIWRNHKWRGEQPGTPGINLREHSAYLKSSAGGTWIVGNDLRGGNRTGFQIRPEPKHNSAPVGAVVIANNVADGYGWNNGSDGPSFDGGSCLTVWANPNSATYVFGNRITDAKYGCLAITAQGPGLDYPGDNGFPIGPVYVYGNTFENKRGDRDVAAITSTEAVHLYANEVQGRFVLNDTWPMKRHGIANGAILLHDPLCLDLELWSWDSGAGKILRVRQQRAREWLAAGQEQAEQAKAEAEASPAAEDPDATGK